MVDLQFREKKGVLVMYNEEEIKKQFPHKKFNHKIPQLIRQVFAEFQDLSH